MELTTLSALLLFLGEGQSGYDVRRLFQTTPIAVFSDSPGAIYPALARLERAGLLVGEAQPSARRRRIYRRTPAGESALDQWLGAPVAMEMVERRPHEVELRFVLIAARHGLAAAAPFLDNAIEALERRIADLEAYCAANQAMGTTSLAALDLGIRLFRTRLDWCREMQRKGEEE
jgi:DNA-binding PadR family transcriptional regulator